MKLEIGRNGAPDTPFRVDLNENERESRLGPIHDQTFESAEALEAALGEIEADITQHVIGSPERGFMLAYKVSNGIGADARYTTRGRLVV